MKTFNVQRSTSNIQRTPGGGARARSPLDVGRWTLSVGCFFLFLSSAHSAGFTEPPITFYGKVTNTFDGYALDLAKGQLTFTIQPALGGTALNFTTPLSAIGGGYSYRLKIPVEKVPGGFTVTAGSIAAPAASTGYVRGATLNNAPVTISLPALPAGQTFTFAENQRGKIERVVLTLSTAFTDTDGDGVPNWWEIANGYDPTDPSDFTDDRDGDTANALTEYREHTLPSIYEYDYRRWAAQHNLVGPEFPMTADIDFDGIPNAIEFAVDTDPRIPDAALARSRMPGSIQDIAGLPYYVFTVTKPALRRTRTAYVAESSLALSTWGSAEGSDLITVEDNFVRLRVRSVPALTGPGAVSQQFFRLKIMDLP